LGGGIPYRDFFDHHLPFAWYFAAILLKLSFGSYIGFRFLWALIAFLSLLSLGVWIRRTLPDLYKYFLVFAVLYPLMGVYFWFHLYLADSLAVLFLSLSFWILIVETMLAKRSLKVLGIASFFTFSMIFSSLTYVYLGGVFYAWMFYLTGWKPRQLIKLLAITLVPYFVFLLFLVLTGSWDEFYFSNVVYNTVHYISMPNFERGVHFNPVKFAVTLFYNFYSNYVPLLMKIKEVNMYLPIGVLGGIGTLSLCVLLFARNVPLGFLYFAALSFSAPRSNVQLANETDYQMSVFLVFGFISALVALYLLQKVKTHNIFIYDSRRVVQLALAFLLVFSVIPLAKNTYDKFYMRYTQKMPSIKDYSYASQFIDNLVGNNYFWYGPYEPDNEFFVKTARLPGKYPTLLPQFSEDEYMKTDFISQFEAHPPEIIIYKHDSSIFMRPALQFGKFFLDWMNDKYTSVENIKGVTVLRSPSEFNLGSDLYLLNKDESKLLQKLRDQSYIAY
ncbi:hypothetical protein HGB07_06675, partial [Candidatus Roizmanbacteria bacterium]|nr:hypothetical protein [Candidatus Roizmanbacteria bacterium]